MWELDWVEVKRKVDELFEFIKDKYNVHGQIKSLVGVIRSGTAIAEREQQEWRKRAECAEKALKELTEKAKLTATLETEQVWRI